MISASFPFFFDLSSPAVCFVNDKRAHIRLRDIAIASVYF